MAGERTQRRLAAILAADIVGYSRLMRRDEAGTLAQLKALRLELLDPKIAEYGGRMAKIKPKTLCCEISTCCEIWRVDGPPGCDNCFMVGAR